MNAPARKVETAEHTPTLANVIARLCEATGPDPRLDADIYDVVRPHSMPWGSRFTESVDAALTLVPEGFHVRKLAEFSDGWYCTVIKGPITVSGEQKPAAIAICIAALKARDAKATGAAP